MLLPVDPVFIRVEIDLHELLWQQKSHFTRERLGRAWRVKRHRRRSNRRPIIDRTRTVEGVEGPANPASVSRARADHSSAGAPLRLSLGHQLAQPSIAGVIIGHKP